MPRYPAAFASAVLLALVPPAPPAHAAAACEVQSGTSTAALVELYTSEGCSSCPPADSRLRALRSQLPANAVVVPLGLHVTYWDGLGWRDPFAQPAFDARQRALLDQRRLRVAYTPQFFVNGDELRDWQSGLPATIRRLNATPAAASIILKTASITRAGTGLRLDVQARLTDAQAAGDLYVAITESGLVSQVKRGENGGATLHHDDTVRLWLGPVAFTHGRAELHSDIALPPQWRGDGLRALAFVQDQRAHVLQAVDTSACVPPMAPTGSPQ
ncbi:DUF1223 domain-containing protein [Duganella callida]|uniref:DUF1223 domain-containing protein n=2 Tax=Duganella callida TaxID=2561932 RepID=A0A4Y9T154_9BURK|nr:DUF1223 domain-containing protein [Duganella callida]